MVDHKVCIVTGASGGIGSRIVEKFLAENYDVVMADLKLEQIEEAIEKNRFDLERIMVCPLDITDENAVALGIKEIVSREQVLRDEIDRIIAEIEE